MVVRGVMLGVQGVMLGVRGVMLVVRGVTLVVRGVMLGVRGVTLVVSGVPVGMEFKEPSLESPTRSWRTHTTGGLRVFFLMHYGRSWSCASPGLCTHNVLVIV